MCMCVDDIGVCFGILCLHVCQLILGVIALHTSVYRLWWNCHLMRFAVILLYVVC